MIILLKNHKSFEIVFEYLKIEVSFFYKKEKRILDTVKTICKIFQEQVSLAEAEIICGSTDIPQKLFGNMKALAKTLELLPITREEKKEFWKQFNEKLDVSEIQN